MGLRVVVLDPLPMFRHGAEAVLSTASHVVDTPDDVLAWARHEQDGVVLLSLLAAPDWELLERLRDESSVVALLDDEPSTVGARAVWAGATSVLPRGATAQALLRTVEATADGQAGRRAGDTAARRSHGTHDRAARAAANPDSRATLVATAVVDGVHGRAASVS